MRRMYSEKFILSLVARIEALEEADSSLDSRVEALENRANYDISLSENNELIIDDLNDNEED